jgi:dTMP kinase
MLAQRLTQDGLSVLLTAEPSDGPIGLIIRSFTSRPDPEEETRLFTEDRRDHVQRVIIPALKEGRIVICDRYVYSSLAYQGARGVDPAGIISANCSFAVRPDVTFLMQVPVDLAISRIKSGRHAGFSFFESKEELKKVAAMYESLNDPTIIRINRDESPEKIHERVVELFWSLKRRSRESGIHWEWRNT